jgi:hypothetical protein
MYSVLTWVQFVCWESFSLAAVLSVSQFKDDILLPHVEVPNLVARGSKKSCIKIVISNLMILFISIDQVSMVQFKKR